MVSTNDCTHAFPILTSTDLANWQHAGFAFTDDNRPAWTMAGIIGNDFWAPEICQVGDEFWLCFAARQPDHSFAIGLAKASHPTGPYRADAEPLVTGGVIDPHLFIDQDGSPVLFWKEDNNDRWPGLLAAMLHATPDLIGDIFPAAADSFIVTQIITQWPRVEALRPMDRFLALQPMIAAAAEDFQEFQMRLQALTQRDDAAIVDAAHATLTVVQTRIMAQRLSTDGRCRLDVPTEVLANDLAWEGHSIEGAWVSQQQGKYYLFYAGNDFSTPHYGIGVAVAETLFGPYRKITTPLLQSSAQWHGPGHPSLVTGLDGRPQLMLHAFAVGAAGCAGFRSLVTTTLSFDDEEVQLLG